MAETFLELCGHMLRSLGTRLCLAECDQPPGDCCDIPGSGPNWWPYNALPPFPNRQMFRRFTPAWVCCSEYTLDEELVSTLTDFNSPDNGGGVRFKSQQTITYRLRLNGPNVGETDILGGSCDFRWQLPVRETLDDEVRILEGEPGPGAEPYHHVTQSEYCTGATVLPWPRSYEAIHDPRAIPLQMSGMNPPTYVDRPRFSQPLTIDPPDRVYGSYYAAVAFDWSGEDTAFRWTYAGQSRQVTFFRSLLTDGSWFINRTIVVEKRASASVSVSGRWQTNCDGTQGPSGGCPIVETECNPGLLRYIIGRRCDSGAMGARPFVLPEFGVQNCGTIRGPDGHCYTFSPDGPRVIDPASINAQVGIDYVGPSSPKTCCDCGSGCDKVDLGDGVPVEWVNGLRGPDGVFRTSPAFVAGRCCCYPNDVFRLINQWSTLTAYNGDGTPAWTERFDIVAGPLPQNFVTGFRRDDPTRVVIGYGLRFRLYDGAGNLLQDEPDYQRVDCAGPNGDPIGCVWQGVASPSLAQEYAFLSPLNAEGMHVRGQNGQVPFPWYQGLDNGGNGIWWINRYSVVANCGALGAEGEWVRTTSTTDPLAPVVLRIQASASWSLASVPLIGDPCSGGCDGSTIPPAGPSLPPIAGTIPDLRTLLGGL